jgi:hypothetical protein
MGSKQWQKSQNGPDWMDIRTTMEAIGLLHRVNVVLTLTPGAHTGSPFTWHFTCVAMDTDASVMGQCVVDLSGEWPCKDHADLSHCLYAGLLSLDYSLSSKVWQQNKLPFTAE